jgi:fructose PTS system EIIBC or EIIC component
MKRTVRGRRRKARVPDTALDPVRGGGYLCTPRAPKAAFLFVGSRFSVLLTELLTPERIKIPLESRSKDDLLVELVTILDGSPGFGDRAEVLSAVREREAVLSTGIGNGVAIPHGKTSAVSGLALAAGVTPEAVDFDALDGRPVQLFFLLVGSESAAGQHVKALSRISRMLRNDELRERLMRADSAESFYAVVEEAEQA